MDALCNLKKGCRIREIAEMAELSREELPQGRHLFKSRQGQLLSTLNGAPPIAQKIPRLLPQPEKTKKLHGKASRSASR
jgi:hypothetical protein